VDPSNAASTCRILTIDSGVLSTDSLSFFAICGPDIRALAKLRRLFTSSVDRARIRLAITASLAKTRIITDVNRCTGHGLMSAAVPLSEERKCSHVITRYDLCRQSGLTPRAQATFNHRNAHSGFL
jgi:hypothetical protein